MFSKYFSCCQPRVIEYSVKLEDTAIVDKDSVSNKSSMKRILFLVLNYLFLDIQLPQIS